MSADLTEATTVAKKLQKKLNDHLHRHGAVNAGNVCDFEIEYFDLSVLCDTMIEMSKHHKTIGELMKLLSEIAHTERFVGYWNKY